MAVAAATKTVRRTMFSADTPPEILEVVYQIEFVETKVQIISSGFKYPESKTGYGKV